MFKKIRGVQDNKRQDLGGDLPRVMPPKKSEMDGVDRVPPIPHERRMLGRGLQVQQDAPPGVIGPKS